MNKLLKTISMCLLLMIVSGLKAQVNDSNTPLHLMTPQYKLKYGISTVDEVKQTMDKVLHYIASVTPA